MSPARPDARRGRVRRSVAVVAAAALVGGGLPLVGLLSSSPAAAAPGPTLSLEVPASVGLGQPLDATLVLRHGREVAGYQAVLGFDTSAAALQDVVGAAPRLSASYGPTTSLPTVPVAAGVALGAFSCTTDDCLRRSSSAVADDVVLGTVRLSTLKPGSLQLALGATRFVDGDGRPVDVDLPERVTVAVGAGSARLAPAVAPAPLTGAPAAGDRPDATGDGKVSTTDLAVRIADWQSALEQGAPCATAVSGAPDVDGDGCQTVSDVQVTAAQAEPTEPAAPADTTPARRRATGARAAAAAPIVYTVNSTLDTKDTVNDGVCGSAGVCTLRGAISEASRRTTPVRIEFAIPGAGPHTIQSGARMDLYNPAGITIDGYTQPGAQVNTDPRGSNAVLKIQVEGLGYGAGGTATSDGFFLPTANNVIRGIAMYKTMRSVWLIQTGALHNRVVGNWLCTDVTATMQATGVRNGGSGVALTVGASSNVIGTPALEDRNVLSGCAHHGLVGIDPGTNSNVVQNNIVGLAPDGTRALPNQSHGLDLNQGNQRNTLGGRGPREGNVVSGNGQNGIEVSHNSNTLHNDVLGNLVGTDLTGNAAPAYARNKEQGIRLEGWASCGDCPEDAGFSRVEGNTVVNSHVGGILVDKGRHDDVITNNRVGVTLNGTPAGNRFFGIRVEKGSVRTTVGPGNVVAANDNGIQIQPVGSNPGSAVSVPTHRNTVTRNSVYGNTGQGLDLAPLYQANPQGGTDPNVNNGISAPVLGVPSRTQVTGTTCASCTVELFLSDGSAGSAGYGAGRTFLTSGVASASGAFTLPLTAEAASRDITATATLPGGGTSEFSRNVAVPAAATDNTAPIADIAGSCSGGVCSFDGRGSVDPDGALVRYEWDFGDGTTATGATTTHRYSASGTYTTRLTVTDNGAATGTTTQTRQVVTRPPVARGTVTCSYQNCRFDGTASTAPDGSVASYSWDLGDGTTASGPVVERYYPTTGTRTATLTVTDDRGATGTQALTVAVTGPSASVLASDSFSRTAPAGSWSNADFGGPWTTGTTPYSVDGGKGRIASAGGGSRTAYLSGVSALDVDVVGSFSASALPTGTGYQVVGLLARRTGPNLQYQARARLMGDGTVRMAVSKLTGSSQDAVMGPEQLVPRVSAAPGTTYRMRVQAVGTSPTTVRARIWPAGTAEPTTWDVSVADSQPALQAAGGVGVFSYESAPAGTVPLTLSFDDFQAGTLNAPPQASFTTSCSARTCSFDATASSDPDGTVESFGWDFGDGTTGAGPVVSHTYATQGAFAVRLTATDDRGATGSAAGTGTAANAAPTAAASASCTHRTCSFDATGSQDADGPLAGYAWTFGDGSSASGPQVSHTYAATGSRTATLVVTDADGATATTTVVAEPTGRAPAAAFGFNCSGRTCELDASASTDPDGDALAYAWDLGDGSTATGARTSRTYASPGEATVTLTVTDADGMTATATRVVTAPGSAPAAGFTASCTELTCSFDGTASSDADGDALTYAWDLGDGTTSSEATPSRTYAAAGDRSVTLVVTDPRGLTGTQTQVVSPSTDSPPTAAFTVACAARTCSFDAAGSSDPEGGALTYAWDLGDGSTATGVAPSRTYAATGSYPVELVVTDARGQTATATRTAVVTGTAPTASFTVSCAGLTCAYDASASSDPDGPVASYAWSFGDGTTGSGVTASRTYAAGGPVTVSLVVTDGTGRTGSTTRSATPVSPAPTTYVADAFGRTATNGWGAADTGGAWTLRGGAASYSVDGSVAKLRTGAAGTGQGAYLKATRHQDVDATVTFSYDKPAVGGQGMYTHLVGRSQADNSGYQLRARVMPDGTVRVAPVRLSGSSAETVIGPEVIAPGITYTAGTAVTLRFEVKGSGTTTLRGKAWRTGTAEPAAWLVSQSDTTAALQAPGYSGVYVYVSGAASNAPLVTSFDDLRVRQAVP